MKKLAEIMKDDEEFRFLCMFDDSDFYISTDEESNHEYKYTRLKLLKRIYDDRFNLKQLNRFKNPVSRIISETLKIGYKNKTEVEESMEQIFIVEVAKMTKGLSTIKTITELAPFISAIANGIDSIMTTHIIFSAIDEAFPATLSEKVLQGLLRNTLGYEGLIITDGMGMAAISSHYGTPDVSSVLAIKAGVDILLYTGLADPKTAHSAIIKAVNNNEIIKSLKTATYVAVFLRLFAKRTKPRLLF